MTEHILISKSAVFSTWPTRGIYHCLFFQWFWFLGEIQSLRIFEPRYRQMLDDCLLDDKPFGMIMTDPLSFHNGWNGLEPMAARLKLLAMKPKVVTTLSSSLVVEDSELILLLTLLCLHLRMRAWLI